MAEDDNRPTLGTVEEQRQKARTGKMSELRSRIVDIDAQFASLAEHEVLTEAEETLWSDLEAEREALMPEYRKLEARAATIEKIQQDTFRQIRGMPEVKRSADELRFADVRAMDVRTARDGALRILDDPESTRHVLSPHQQDVLDKMVRKDTGLARRILVTENDDYRSAWMKLLTEPNAAAILSDDERTALQRFYQFRAQDEGATTHGGFAIPVFIDPSVILTDQETDNPFLRLAKQVDVNTNAWKGVSAAGVVWSFDPEASAVSDDSITLAQPSVTVFMARGFIPYSIEVGQDWPGFQAEMAGLLSAGYDELLINKFSTGSGTNEPRGLITALGANASSQVKVTTVGSLGQEDAYKLWKSLPQKYRRRAAWMMSVDVMNRVRQFGAANVYHAYTVNLPEGAVDMLFARQVYENAYFSDFLATTGINNIAVVGDFNNYVIAKRSGMSVELVPQLFDVTNNRPTGQRGWFAYARIGGNSVNDLGFRLLDNT